MNTLTTLFGGLAAVMVLYVAGGAVRGLPPMLRALHRSEQHQGKVPSQADPAERMGAALVETHREFESRGWRLSRMPCPLSPR